MSTHTTYFCDYCNSDHDTDYSDGRQAISHDYPPHAGWAEFEAPYVGYFGDTLKAEIHVCAHCLADPEFEPRRGWTLPKWDDAARENVAAGRKLAEAYEWALEHLGRRDQWGVAGVRQVLEEFYGYGHRPGPRFEDGRFRTDDVVRPPSPSKGQEPRA